MKRANPPTLDTIQRVDSARQIERIRRAAPLATAKPTTRFRIGRTRRQGHRRLWLLLGALLAAVVFIAVAVGVAKASGSISIQQL